MFPGFRTKRASPWGTVARLRGLKTKSHVPYKDLGNDKVFDETITVFIYEQIPFTRTIENSSIDRIDSVLKCESGFGGNELARQKLSYAVCLRGYESILENSLRLSANTFVMEEKFKAKRLL